MSITRTRLRFEDHYTQLPNRWARDGRLTLKARGLLAQLLSHRAGWRVSVASLAAVNPEGRDAIRGAVAELEALGYLERSQSVDGESGRFGSVEYVLADPWADSPSSDNPSTVPPAETGHNGRSAPMSGFPTTDDPTSGNPPHKKTIPTEDHLTEHHENTVGDADGGAEVVRSDVLEVCRIVADHVEAVTGKRPTAGARWETQARLMLDRDGRTVDEVRVLMAWVTASAFWSPNILSVPKLRDKWDTLAGQAVRDARAASSGGGWLERELARAAAFSNGGAR